jgi:hypothetical protein
VGAAFAFISISSSMRPNTLFPPLVYYAIALIASAPIDKTKNLHRTRIYENCLLLIFEIYARRDVNARAPLWCQALIVCFAVAGLFSPRVPPPTLLLYFYIKIDLFAGTFPPRNDKC